MKKLMIVLALALAGQVQAMESSIGNGLAHTGTDGRAVVKVMGADFSGNTGTGSLVTCANCTGAAPGMSVTAQLLAGTAFAGYAGISPNAGSPTNPMYVNSNAPTSLTICVLTGVTTNAVTVQSLSAAAGTSTGGPFFITVNCSGATTVDFLTWNSATVPAGYLANAAVFDQQPCGQIGQVPIEVPASNTHFMAVAVGLSFTSATVGVKVQQRL